MTPHNKDKLRTAYTISVDARDGVTTGISAADRCGADAGRLRHRAVGAHPPRSRLPAALPEGGVLVRRGHTPRRPSTSPGWGSRPPACWSRW